MKLEILTNYEKREIQNKIIAGIRDWINHKNLEPGDKLPAERVLSEKFEVSRSSVREAIQKLEFYGILKSIPQSGTFVANIGAIAVNGMIEDILSLDTPDFRSLVETRILLELKTVRLAALRRSEEDLDAIKMALEAYTEKISTGQEYLQEDLLFHLAIAKASKNNTMLTLMLLITPEIIIAYDKDRVCEGDEAQDEIRKHNEIYLAIKNQNPDQAKLKMKIHFTKLYEYIYGDKNS